MVGVLDPVHLAYAVQHGLILVTKDPDDFRDLHRQDQNHPGIFGIYQDNDRIRDMTRTDIVAAIGRIEAAGPLGYPIAGEFHILNDWR
jgi:predicted nuclease of predicted toxin-antitoxin system